MSVWDNPGEMLQRAQAARAQGDRELAYQMFARASELAPQDALAWEGRAETATSSDEALVSYAYAAALEPDNQTLARTLEASVSQRVTSAETSDVPLLLALGQELAEVGLTTPARALLARATELDPNSTDALVWLAGFTDDDGRKVELLERATATDARDPRAQAGLIALRAPTVASTPEVSSPPPGAAPSPSTEVQALLEKLQDARDDDERLQLYDRILALDPGNLSAREARTNLRLKRIREHDRSDAASSLRRTSPANSDARLRLLLVVLLILFLILAAAGILLLLLQ